MEDIIKHIAKAKEVAFKKETTSWFNGHAYFPLHSYWINYQFHGWEITLYGEWRVSEFVRSEKNAGNPFSSVYLWSIQATKSDVAKEVSFEISRSSWLKRRMGILPFVVKSNDQNLKMRFMGMRALEDWFLYTHPIDNVFTCKTKDGKSFISTAFNTEFDPRIKVQIALGLIEFFCSVIDVKA